MVFIKSGEIIIPYQKKLSYAEWFSLKVEKYLFHTQKKLSYAAWFSLKVDK